MQRGTSLSGMNSVIKRCSYPGCAEIHCAKGYCQKHYNRWVRNGTPKGWQPTIPECHPDRPHRAKGMCGPCYFLAYRGGEPRNAYGKILVEELDFQTFTWDALEESFGTTREKLAKSLWQSDRKDLRSKVNLATYGTDDKYEIKGIRQRGRAR